MYVILYVYEIRGFHGGEDVDLGLLGSNAAWTFRQIPMFRRNILPPSSGLMIEAACSSETLVST
jgi:hypothetical protein